MSGIPDWTSFVQKSGYPMIGEPNALTYYRPPTDVEIHALLSYDATGYLQGGLMYFPKGSPFDFPGSVTVIVRPNRRRRGVGRALVMTALTTWPEIDTDHQAYTASGRSLVDSVLAQPFGGTP